MAIRFRFNHQNWEADTIDEAIALRAKLQRSMQFPPDPHKEADRLERFWTPDRFMDVITNIGKLQHRFLEAIYEKSGISSAELVERLGLGSEIALAGVISGLSKHLRKVGILPKHVFLITVDWTGKKKNRTFILDDFFKGACMEHNWPEAWKAELKGDEPNTRTA